MSEVQFEEDNFSRICGQGIRKQEKTRISGFIEGLGVPEEYVDYALVGVIVCTLAIAIIAFPWRNLSFISKKTSVPASIRVTNGW